LIYLKKVYYEYIMTTIPDVTGVKGSYCYSEEAVGDIRLSLFTQLVRSASTTFLVRRAFREYPEDTVVMAFQTRDIRKGKGERKLFAEMLKEILKMSPRLARPLLCLVPEYGRWDDVWELYGKVSEEVSAAVDEVVLDQFRSDQESEHPSLLAKWLPREGRPLAKHFADLLFPLVPSEKGQRMRSYRKTVAFLNKKMATVEIDMCAGTWKNIKPEAVPGQLMRRCGDAFLNATRGRKRASEKDDRIKCAEIFRAFLDDVKEGKAKIHGGDTTMPHEHVQDLLKSDRNDDSITEAQWNEIVTKTRGAGGLGRAVFMCDFSGSMSGTPLNVSLALGILGSQVITVPGFRNRIMTFDSTPMWHTFGENDRLYEKIHSLGDLGVGMSTNFAAAYELILDELVKNKVPVAEAPTHLFVITDMGFDSANSQGRSQKWSTHFQDIRLMFESEGYTPPLIVNWNVSAAYKDAHATAHEVGVVQLSGWSPSLLETIQNGIDVQTPYECLRKLLDNPRYDPVRLAFASASTEAEAADA
jgi:hypothetical protein